MISLDEIKIKLNEYRKLCNEGLVEAKKQKIEGAINWGNLYCFDARYSIGFDDEDEIFQLYISEASPDNDHLKQFLCNYIYKRIKDQDILNIITEW